MTKIIFANRHVCFIAAWLMMLLLPNCSAHSTEMFSLDGIDIYLKPDEIVNGIPNDTHLSVMDVTIGKHSLDDVQAKFGKTEMLSRKEHEPRKICYSLKQDNALNIIVFEAGPLGGWKTITGFSFYDSNSKFDERELCTESSSSLKTVHTISGIKIGMSINELINIMGKPSRILDNEVIYVYQSKRKMSKPEMDNLVSLWPEVRKNPFLDVTSCIFAKFHNSKLAVFKATKIESY